MSLRPFTGLSFQYDSARNERPVSRERSAVSLRDTPNDMSHMRVEMCRQAQIPILMVNLTVVNADGSGSKS